MYLQLVTGQAAAEKHGMQLEVVKHTEVKWGSVLLPRRREREAR